MGNAAATSGDDSDSDDIGNLVTEEALDKPAQAAVVVETTSKYSVSNNIIPLGKEHGKKRTRSPDNEDDDVTDTNKRTFTGQTAEGNNAYITSPNIRPNGPYINSDEKRDEAGDVVMQEDDDAASAAAAAPTAGDTMDVLTEDELSILTTPLADPEEVDEWLYLLEASLRSPGHNQRIMQLVWEMIGRDPVKNRHTTRFNFIKVKGHEKQTVTNAISSHVAVCWQMPIDVVNTMQVPAHVSPAVDIQELPHLKEIEYDYYTEASYLFISDATSLLTAPADGRVVGLWALDAIDGRLIEQSSTITNGEPGTNEPLAASFVSTPTQSEVDVGLEYRTGRPFVIKNDTFGETVVVHIIPVYKFIQTCLDWFEMKQRAWSEALWSGLPMLTMDMADTQTDNDNYMKLFEQMAYSRKLAQLFEQFASKLNQTRRYLSVDETPHRSSGWLVNQQNKPLIYATHIALPILREEAADFLVSSNIPYPHIVLLERALASQNAGSTTYVPLVMTLDDTGQLLIKSASPNYSRIHGFGIEEVDRTYLEGDGIVFFNTNVPNPGDKSPAVPSSLRSAGKRLAVLSVRVFLNMVANFKSHLVSYVTKDLHFNLLTNDERALLREFKFYDAQSSVQERAAQLHYYLEWVQAVIRSPVWDFPAQLKVETRLRDELAPSIMRIQLKYSVDKENPATASALYYNLLLEPPLQPEEKDLLTRAVNVNSTISRLKRLIKTEAEILARFGRPAVAEIHDTDPDPAIYRTILKKRITWKNNHDLLASMKLYNSRTERLVRQWVDVIGL